jgi:putative NADPH-quinone reductase
MTPADEPDWANRDKEYSAEVKAHMRRIDAADSIVVVFPIWWYAPPAILKGWIDRVWNYGYAYGRSKPRFSGKRIIWIGLAGEPQEGFAEMAELVDRYLRVAISNYCGIGDVSVRLIFNTLAEGVAKESRADHLRNVFASADGALDDFFGSRAPVGV